ncbi:carboxypeptidase-like regulatory domain-containing protein [Hymenobacter elongatus]|uniref:Carboxypeptidase-like regulatory domain-containing protein n=2 Tax=Hymenobacter elongatus TaxID=877208 RepID=A0A4Z0PJC9_9BACT|nr:carboxypeptidase-like regulatory domain-containing protein [Hymenobacter elongatus]
MTRKQTDRGKASSTYIIGVSPFVERPNEAETAGTTCSILSGQVTDKQDGTPLPGVTVLLEGTRHGVSTDHEGHFSLPITDTERHYRLLFRSVGYNEVARIQPTDEQALEIQRTASPVGVVHVVVMGVLEARAPMYTPRGMWQRLRGLPRRVAHAFQRQ